MDELLVEGTEYERAMTAAGALLAYAEGDRAVLATYPQLFSVSYLTFGLLGMAGGLLFAIPNHEQALDDLSKLYSTGPEAALVQVLRELQESLTHRVRPSSRAITEEEWQGLLTVSFTCASAFAEASSTTVTELLSHIRQGLLQKSVSD